MSEQNAEKTQARCPGCGHTCCPYPSLECGGDSDVVAACDEHYVPLTMEQIEDSVEEVIEANAVWPDPLTSQVSAVMDIMREAMWQARREALREARGDIKARITTFRDLDAHPEYMNALNDAWGLVANRERMPFPPGKGA